MPEYLTGCHRWRLQPKPRRKAVHAGEGKQLLKEGKVPETPEAELDEAIRIGLDFERNIAPILQALRVAC